jgi:hypothetical protein
MTPLRATLAALSLVVCACLTSCGKNSVIPLGTITGNWFIYNIGFPQGSIPVMGATISGAITQTGNNLGANLHIDTACLGNGQTTVPFTGTFNPETNRFTLNSASVNGETLVLEGTFSAVRESFNNGYFSMNGTCTGNIVSLTGDDKGAIQNPEGLKIPSLTGSWSPIPNQPSTLNLIEQLTQSPTPDIHGDFALTGTVTVTGSPCFTSGILQPSSFITGYLGQQVILMNDGSTLTATLQAGESIIPVTTSLTLYAGSITGGNCNGPIDVYLQQPAP